MCSAHAEESDGVQSFFARAECEEGMRGFVQKMFGIYYPRAESVRNKALDVLKKTRSETVVSETIGDSK